LLRPGKFTKDWGEKSSRYLCGRVEEVGSTQRGPKEGGVDFSACWAARPEQDFPGERTGVIAGGVSRRTVKNNRTQGTKRTSGVG